MSEAPFRQVRPSGYSYLLGLIPPGRAVSWRWVLQRWRAGSFLSTELRTSIVLGRSGIMGP